jgi:hypothetical protein
MDIDPGPEDQTGWGGLTSSTSTRAVRVDVKTLDQVLPAETQIEVLKIDTEGADHWVLEGAQQLLRERRINHIFFEQNVARMKALAIAEDAPRRLLEASGYRVEAFGGSGQNEELYACPAESGPGSSARKRTRNSRTRCM